MPSITQGANVVVKGFEDPDSSDLLRNVKVVTTEGNLELVEISNHISPDSSIININNRFTIKVKNTLDLSSNE